MYINTQIEWMNQSFFDTSKIIYIYIFVHTFEFDGFSHVFTYYAKRGKKLYSRGCVIVRASSISGEKFPPLLKCSTREQGQ